MDSGKEMLLTHTNKNHGKDLPDDTQGLSAVGYLSTSTDILGTLSLTYLFLQSYWNNRQHNLTGRLYYDGMQYGLILEGNPKSINYVAGLIENDGRHKVQKKLHLPNIAKRQYQDWSMYFDGADTIVRVLPGYSHAIRENNGQSANQVIDLMDLYDA